ncbi:hypothetical protein HQQ80_13420 [Microbacteriaceae bacterium VKM Ac-2855]|nr:hypothetical protein [Microbacteriaceae bacterium VKM Ac-2855]
MLDATSTQLGTDIDSDDALRTRVQALNADADALNTSIDLKLGRFGGP